MEKTVERIVFLDRNAIRVPLPQPEFAHEWIEYPHTENSAATERLRGATIAITNRVPITGSILDQVPTLRLIAAAATGYDHIDVRACASRGVAVCNIRNWSISVPEHVFAMALSLRRQLPAYREALAAGAWEKSSTYCVLLEPMPRTLAGSTLGLIGYGELAKRVERIASGFGMHTLVAERREATAIREGRTPFKEVLSRSDVLVVLCPLTRETRGLVGQAELAMMKREAILINCARGGIVDEAALLSALLSGSISGAATDVLSEEPPSNGSPLLAQSLPNLIVTPHIAWASVESLNELARGLISNLEAYVAGKPTNLVDA